MVQGKHPLSTSLDQQTMFGAAELAKKCVLDRGWVTAGLGVVEELGVSINPTDISSSRCVPRRCFLSGCKVLHKQSALAMWWLEGLLRQVHRKLTNREVGLDLLVPVDLLGHSLVQDDAIALFHSPVLLLPLHQPRVFAHVEAVL